MLQKRLEEIFHLWDQLTEFGTHAGDDAFDHCISTLGGWLGAERSFWVGTVRIMDGKEADKDAMCGWRIGALHPGTPQRKPPNEPDAVKNIDKEARWSGKVKMVDTETPSSGKPKALDIADTNLALIAGAGRYRSYVLSQGTLVDLERFRATDHYDFYYRRMGVSDRIWVVFPVNAYGESCFCFDRCVESNDFTTDELELAAFALRGIKWFHRQLLMSHGLGVAEAPVTLAERKVLQKLLTGASEKAIANELGISSGTVHQYATRIYRKFGARGRTEFTSLWLNGAPDRK